MKAQQINQVSQYAMIENKYYKRIDGSLVEIDSRQVHRERVREDNILPIQIAVLDRVSGKYFIVQHN